MNDYVLKLISCGFSEENAQAIYNNYKSRKDLPGLARFIQNAEQLNRED